MSIMDAALKDLTYDELKHRFKIANDMMSEYEKRIPDLIGSELEEAVRYRDNANKGCGEVLLEIESRKKVMRGMPDFTLAKNAIHIVESYESYWGESEQTSQVKMWLESIVSGNS